MFWNTLQYRTWKVPFFNRECHINSASRCYALNNRPAGLFLRKWELPTAINSMDYRWIFSCTYKAKMVGCLHVMSLSSPHKSCGTAVSTSTHTRNTRWFLNDVLSIFLYLHKLRKTCTLEDQQKRKYWIFIYCLNHAYYFAYDVETMCQQNFEIYIFSSVYNL